MIQLFYVYITFASWQALYLIGSVFDLVWIDGMRNKWMNELNVWRYSRCVALTEVVITEFSCIFIHKSFPSVLQMAHWVSTKGRERPICRQQNDLQWCVGVHDMGRKLWNGMWGTSVTRIECWSREPHLLSQGSK